MGNDVNPYPVRTYAVSPIRPHKKRNLIVLKLNLVSIAATDLHSDMLQQMLHIATGMSTNEILSALEKERFEQERIISQLTTISGDFLGDEWMMNKIDKTRNEAMELSSACRQIVHELKKFDTREFTSGKLSKAYIRELYKSVMNKQTAQIEKVNTVLDEMISA